MSRKGNGMFKVAGVSRTKDGVVKVRFANDLSRVKILIKAENTDIELIDLPKEMEKSEIAKYLLTTDLAKNEDFKRALEAADEKYNPVVKVKTPKTPKVKATKKSKETEVSDKESEKEAVAD